VQTVREPLPPLDIVSLGRFRVTAGGRRVVFHRKRSRYLFQLLLTAHPGALHEEVIMERLWPDGDPIKSRANLQTCVTDLRRALDPHYEPRGASYVIYDEQQYRLELPRESRFDAIAFLESVERFLAERDEAEAMGSSHLDELRQTLDGFGGEFLPEQRYESFAIEFRERLHQRFLDAALFGAEHLVHRGEHRAAAELIERGLELDPLWAEGIELLMLARARGGELFRALRTYREYERRLADELGLPPDRDLARFFERLSREHATVE
jgi:DNA-binding SARP family transcriptional activator